jgi:type II restriction enzyme
VHLQLPDAPPQYKSPQQRVRCITEDWGEANLYCANCDSDELNRLKHNTPSIDFDCPKCNAVFQLKGRKSRIGGTITDAAYEKMRERILVGAFPNLLALHYDSNSWKVRNLTLIPHFAFSLAALKRRPPLKETAERHGWVGCNIVLSNIPMDARIDVVSEGVAADPSDVRRKYRRLQPLAELKAEERGWTLDVLNVVRSLGKSEFNLAEVYKSEEQLARLHPANRHVRDKIRQQLQALRDLGILEFLSRGEYRIEQGRG